LGGTCCLHLTRQETAIFNNENNGYYENWYTGENNKTIIWQFGSLKCFIWILSEFYVSHSSALYNFTSKTFVWMITERDSFAQGYYKRIHWIFSSNYK
jgi:hypothetical protein